MSTRQSRSPFWHWLLRMIAWAVVIAFLFVVMAASIYELVKMLR